MPGTDREPSPQASAAEQELRQEAQLEEIPQPFEPLFALLTNTTTNTTVHPRIHYLFSDDDPSILPIPTTADLSHRALIVDLAPAQPENPGRWSVSWASSLSQDFAVTSSNISLQQNEGDDGGLMLRVEGVEREPVEMRGDSLPNSQGSGALGREDVESLAEEFRRRMVVLKKVVGEGGRRREVLGQEEEEGEEAVVDGRDDPGEKQEEKKNEKQKEAEMGDIGDG
ncbi:Fc.00g019450.m01.CDS01 [Cosmosporella sp. VM-42]